MSDLPRKFVDDIIRTEGRGTRSNEARDLAVEVARRRDGGGSEGRRWLKVPTSAGFFSYATGHVPGLVSGRYEVWLDSAGAADYAFYWPTTGWSDSRVTHYRALPEGPTE